MKTPVVAPATSSLPPPRTTASGTTGSSSEKPPKARRTRTNAAGTPGVRASCPKPPGVVVRGVTPTSQRALGRRDPGDPRVRFDRRAERSGDSLVLGLGDVVRVATVVHTHVERDPGVVGERLEDVSVEDGAVRGAVVTGHHVAGHHLGLAGVDTVRPTGHVDDGLGERLVHGQRTLSEPANPALVAEGLPQGLPEDDGGVLDGVVGLDVDVPRGPHGQVEGAVRRERGEHVVEERHTGGDVSSSRAVEIYLHGDRRLRRGPLHAAPPRALLTHRISSVRSPISVVASSALTFSNRSFSCSSPMVARSRPGMPTSRISTPASRYRCQARPASANGP